MAKTLHDLSLADLALPVWNNQVKKLVQLSPDFKEVPTLDEFIATECSSKAQALAALEQLAGKDLSLDTPILDLKLLFTHK